jgi:hypothetical protein
MKKRIGIAVAGFLALFALLGLLGAGDIIDLPAWANVPGVDLPIVGDKDAIDCKLEQVAGTRNVEITIVDGDSSKYPNYVHVFNNGDLVDEAEIDRLSDEVLIVSSTDGVDEQFYAIAVVPFREGRIFCESIVLS